MTALGPAEIRQLIAAGATSWVAAPAEAARFRIGARVTTLLLSPRHHTRLPRYCRGRTGTVVAIHGRFALPDRKALGEAGPPDYLYSVRFEMADLWGPDAEPGTALAIDLWESYLVPAAA